MRKKQISGIMKNEKAIKRILEIKATQWKWINGKLVHIQLSIKDQNEIAALEKLLSNPFSKKEFALYSKIITEAGGTVMKETLQNAKSEKNFFAERISKTHGKHNLPNELWERLCKIRNSPILVSWFIILSSALWSNIDTPFVHVYEHMSTYLDKVYHRSPRGLCIN